MAVIKLNNVTKIYGFGDAMTFALDDIDLIVEEGEFIAIMGPSGSGKSTLLNIIGLLDKPSEGSYSINNKVVSKFHSRKRAKTRRDHIGFVFQAFNLLPKMTALENVALPLAYRGVTKYKRLNRASEVLDKVGLQKKEYYFPKQLSGGQLQRVAIARALVNNPSIIIADEPTGNLDTISSEQIMALLKEVHKAGNTIIMVTHNPDLTAYADRILYLKDGRIMHDKKLEEDEIVDLKQIQAAQDYKKEVDNNIRKIKHRKTKSKKKTKNKKIKKSTPKSSKKRQRKDKPSKAKS